MALNEIAPDAWLLALGTANAVLLREGTELVLIDAGFPDKEQVAFDAIAALGHRPTDLRHLVFTHGHPDHIGSAAAIVRATGARTWMHAADAPLAENGPPFRPLHPSRGIAMHLAYRIFWDQNEEVEPFRIDERFGGEGALPVAGGLAITPTPGHCAGQVAFRWKGRRLLIAGDVFMNIVGLTDPIGYEDEAELRASQRRIGELDFDAAAFGHGRPIRSGASDRVRRKLGIRA